MIEIRDISGKVKLQVLELEGSVHRFELMKEDYILLKFSEEEPVYFDIGDYVETEEGCFYVTEPVYPVFNTSTAGYDYELKLESHYYRWKNHILFYDRQGNKEASWSLTRAPEAHLGIVVSNLRSLGFTYNGKEYQAVVDSTVSGEAKLVQYENTNIVDALTKMAEAWDCEWWVDGDKIYLGRLEYGDPVDLEIGKELYSISRSQSQDIYATRLYVFGSTRNIPSDYRQEESGTVVDGVIQKRLMLPEGTPYIDVVEGLKEEQVIEAVVVLDEVYPKFIGTISSITTVERTTGEGDDSEVFTAYQFKDDSFKFSNEYIIPGETLKLQFQTGPLAGMEFELKFNPNGLPEVNPESQVFEIVRNQDYGQWLPKEPLIPGVGNQYSLLNFDTKYVGDELIPRAEQELLEKGLALKDKMVSDPSTYNCVLNSYKASGYDENYGILNPEKSLDLKAGQKVNLKNPAYFKNGRVTRVIGFEKKLDYPYDSPSYIIGETAAYSRLGELEQKIDNIQLEGNSYANQGGAGAGFYLIKKDDPTAASDENVFSALRTLSEIKNIKDDINEMFLRKDIDDVAAGNIRFKKSISSFTFAEGFLGTGWRVTQEGDIEARSLLLREWLEVPDLRFNRVLVTGDEFWVATGLKVDSVTGNTITAKLEDGDVIAVHEGDILRGIYHHENGFSTSFIKVLTVDTSAGTFTFEKIRGADPVRFMTFARQGNDTDEERQRSIYLSGLDGYMRFMGGVNSADITFDNIYAQFGNLNGLVTPFFGTLTGEGIYIRKGYIEGSIHVTGGNAATKDFVSTEIGKEIAGFAVGVDNLLLNTAFAGDYLPAELEKMTLFNRQKILYSDPLKYWTVNGAATVGTDSSSRSGYACVLSGTLSQSPVVPLVVGEKYVISFRAKGSGSITAGAGGVQEGFVLSSSYQKFVVKLEAVNTDSFFIDTSSSVTICEIKLERGTVATDWEPAFLDNNRMEGRLEAMQYIFNAVKNETEIYGGLILTNILMTGNYTNGKMSEVTAGLSGVYNDGRDVAFWAGGTLEKAIAAVANPTATSNVANAVITHGGLAILNNAYIRGTIYATDGEFRGSIYANTGILTNVLVRTGDTGKRIELSSGNQNIAFYNDSNKKIAEWAFYSTYSRLSLGSGCSLSDTGLVCGSTLGVYSSEAGKIKVSDTGGNYYTDKVFIVDAQEGKSNIWIQIGMLPTTRDAAPSWGLYRDGETIKIKVV